MRYIYIYIQYDIYIYNLWAIMSHGQVRWLDDIWGMNGSIPWWESIAIPWCKGLMMIDDHAAHADIRDASPSYFTGDDGDDSWQQYLINLTATMNLDHNTVKLRHPGGAKPPGAASQQPALFFGSVLFIRSPSVVFGVVEFSVNIYTDIYYTCHRYVAFLRLESRKHFPISSGWSVLSLAVFDIVCGMASLAKSAGCNPLSWLQCLQA
jgi:hypothetical protein